MEASRDEDGGVRSHAEIEVLVEGVTVGRWLLPRQRADVGRAYGSAMRLIQSWIPRRLATFTACDRGWVCENGPRTRVRVQSRWVRDAWFEPSALLLMQLGQWLLSWDLDRECECRLTISNRVREAATTPYALQTTPARDLPRLPSTALVIADHPTKLSPLRRHQLAVLFTYLIADRPRPENVCQAAGDRLGLTEDQVRKVAYKVRDRINEIRPAQLKGLDDLGYYLVVTTGTLGPEDLDP